MAEQVDHDTIDQKPLKSVVLCCTSVAQDVRTKVAEVACEMGAVHKLDLTSDVTHLIVGSITTPKYRYVAKDRPDIKVLPPDWIEDVRQAWMEGGEVDVAELEEKHKLGAFHGFKICITGFDNLEQRTYISDTVQQQGAEYQGDLTRHATHLIAATPSGAKYNAAKLWKLQIVSLRWFEDSVKRGMALDESLYDPMIPTEEQGQGAFRTTVKTRTSLGKRRRDSESQSTEEPGKRRLRRTASSRLHGQSQDMWQDISTSEGTLAPSEVDQWKDESDIRPQRQQSERPSLELVQVRRSDVFSLTSNATSEPEGLFAGRHILIRGFPRERTARLQRFLEPNGATIVPSEAELENASQNAFYKARYLLMPHAFDGTRMDAPDVPAGTELVTEWWVERCIHYKRFFEPAKDALSRPMWDAGIPDFAGLTVCTTGFAGVDFRQTAEAVTLLGAAYEEKLLPSVSVLVCGSETVKKEKAYYATKHEIAVVSAGWLWECLEQKRRVDYDDFRVRLPAFDPTASMRDPSTSSPAPSALVESKRQEAVPKRLSSTRKRQYTPSLPLQAAKATEPEKPAAPRPSRNPAPFVHEDDDDDETPIMDTDAIPPLDGATEASPKKQQPLKELSPNASPRKGSQSQQPADDLEKPKAVEAPKPITVEATTPPTSPKSAPRSPRNAPPQPAPRPAEELSADIAALMHRHSSRPDSAGSQKRKNRPLGRSASGIGNRAVSASAVSDISGGSPALPSEIGESGSAADGFAVPAGDALLPPGTQLDYETEESRNERTMMEKRMKISPLDGGAGRRVASVGTVKDSFGSGGDAGSGVGNRVKGRQRTK